MTGSPPSPAILAIMGGGTMARAIMRGAFDAKLLAAREIVIVEPDASKRAELARWGVTVTPDHAHAVSLLLPPSAYPIGGHVLLAVKPQSMPELARQLGPTLANRGHAVISILAGTPIARLQSLLGGGVSIVRAMPNTPARLRKGITAISAGPGLSPAQSQFAYDLFASLGEVVRLDESLMDAFTALGGSGPAYVFYLAEALVRAAQDVGMDRITADRVVRQTIAGAAALLTESSEPAEELRRQVTSKGGTTEAACTELDARHVMDAFAQAVRAGRDRGAELARG